MYQLLSGQKTFEIRITSILMAYDCDFGYYNFLFYKSELHWYKIYLDEGVIFINVVDNDLDEFLSDLNLIKCFELSFYEFDNFFLEYKDSKLQFIGNKYLLYFDIFNEELIFNKFCS